MSASRWSESPLPILAGFLATMALVGWSELRAVTAADRTRIVRVAAAEDDESRARREPMAMATVEDAEVKAALALAAGGDARGALTALEAMREADPKRVAAHLAAGSIRLKMGEPALAAVAFRQAAISAPADGAILFDLGLALEKSGMTEEAKEAYREAIVLQPALFAARFNLGSLLLESGDGVGAATELALAVPLVAAGPGRARVLTRLGIAHRKAGNAAAARKAFEESILHRPGAVEPRLGLARLDLEAGNVEAASAELAKAVALDPSSATAHFLLGQVASRKNDHETARREYAEAVRLRPESWEARYNLGRTELTAGNLARAAELFASLETERPRDPEVLFHLGRIAYRGEKFQDAAKRYRKAIEARAPEKYPEALLNLGLALRALGDDAGAAAAYRDALAARPGYAEAMFNLGSLELSRNPAEADQWFAKAVETDPGYAEAWFNRGLLAGRASDVAGAELAYRKAIAVRPSYKEAHLNLGALLARAGRYEEAIEENRAVLRADPDSAKAWFNLGRAWSGLEKPKEAAAAYRRAVELDEDYGAAWLNLGVVLADAGEPADAIAVYREALDHRSGDVKLRYNLALQYRKIGDLPAAEAELRRAVRLEPGYRKAWKLLVEVVEARSGKPAADEARAQADVVRKNVPDSAESDSPENP